MILKPCTKESRRKKKKNLRAHSCAHINEPHIDSFHIQDTYGACLLWKASAVKSRQHT